MTGTRRTRPSIAARRHLFVIETPVETATLLGGATITWTPGATFWGTLQPITGSERASADRPEARVEHRITLRFREGLEAGQRLRCGMWLFELDAVFDPDDRARDLVCLASEVKP